MIEFVKNNISWIKDISSIILTIVATIISILTYKRAKTTILQPIRTETIKKQSDILEKLLIFIKDDVDYFNFIQLNVIMLLKEYGFVFNNEENIDAKSDLNCKGAIIILKEKECDFLEVINTFSDDVNKKDLKKHNKTKYEQAVNGIINIDYIYYSEKYELYYEKLNDFINNPFLPNRFIKILTEINNNISINIKEILKKVLENFLKEYFERYKEKNSDFNISGIYNTFNREKISNKELKEKLYVEIRKYLYIDYEWK